MKGLNKLDLVYTLEPLRWWFCSQRNRYRSIIGSKRRPYSITPLIFGCWLEIQLNLQLNRTCVSMARGLTLRFGKRNHIKSNFHEFLQYFSQTVNESKLIFFVIHVEACLNRAPAEIQQLNNSISNTSNSIDFRIEISCPMNIDFF